MANSVTRPRLAVIVGNGISGDSRVEKTAVAAARAGWDVTLVGRAGSARRETYTRGGVTVVKVPVGTEMQERSRARHRAARGALARLARWGLADDRAVARTRAAHTAWVRERTALVGLSASPSPRLAGRLRVRALKSWVRLGRYAYRGRMKLYRMERARGAADAAHAARSGPARNWRTQWPALLDLDLAYGPVIEEIRPDVIHANEPCMIAVAARSAGRLRARGLRTSWLYDAHELVAGPEWSDAARNSALAGVEAEYIGRADAVVTVSGELADILREAHTLPETPLVVRNAPVREAVGAGPCGGASVRTACGLGREERLLVYAGWIGPERGLDTAVEALTGLPGVHLALVCDGERNPSLRALLDTAAKAGVRERVHVVPYVPQEQVPDYLSSADLGLICFRHVPNCEISLPTKAAEYLHAGLPLVTSDVRTVRAFVQEHGIGTVYPSGDAEALTDAVRLALEQRGKLARNITEALRDELSWERQSAGLLRLYERLAGPGAAGLTPRDIPWPGAGARDTRAGAAGVTVPDWRPIPEQGEAAQTRVRLGLGCANYAGQLSGFARAVCRARPDVSAEVTMHTSASPLTGYPADVRIPRGQLGGRDIKLDRVNRALGAYTHYLADAFTPAFGWLNGQHIENDLPALTGAGLRVALLAHGSDVRDPQRHMERYGHSLFHAAPEDALAVLTRNSARNRRVAAESGLPLFATTPDLLTDLPGARWAPLVVDVEGWACGRPAMERARPVVVHAPSRRWTKGTESVMPVLEELDRAGVIEFRLAEGLPWAGMRELVREADIVVDQFAIGTYGTFACEGMAAGKPVVAFLDEQVHKDVGAVPPIVNATPDTLRPALESLLDDRAQAARTGLESVEYVRTYHDGRYTAGVLDGFLS
ncbi:glycosyltransferase [Streptomyces iconiensis]|uniref:Glycosyltransferase n=1 Tax=Streptomyces iconiensis TaxID=1384038 RepID=A0ABT7A8D1_9ACTN|nr:glycosyltransferase [Streptomyces iconiensis]MDJ1137602.1 glycosyltransferase [Streptomyces iconiensis]